MMPEHQNAAFPAKAGIHFSAAPSPDRWVPASAGTAVSE
jgi:hypothetical protein